MSETNLNRFTEVAPSGTFTLQNSLLLKVRLQGDSVQAKLGSMVAYQGGFSGRADLGSLPVAERSPGRGPGKGLGV